MQDLFVGAKVRIHFSNRDNKNMAKALKDMTYLIDMSYLLKLRKQFYKNFNMMTIKTPLP